MNFWWATENFGAATTGTGWDDFLKASQICLRVWPAARISRVRRMSSARSAAGRVAHWDPARAISSRRVWRSFSAVVLDGKYLRKRVRLFFHWRRSECLCGGGYLVRNFRVFRDRSASISTTMPGSSRRMASTNSWVGVLPVDSTAAASISRISGCESRSMDRRFLELFSFITFLISAGI